MSTIWVCSDLIDSHTSMTEPKKRDAARRRQAAAQDNVPKPNMLYDYVDKGPFATFHFKYRSLAALKALRIITEPEEQEGPLEDRPEETLSQAELREAVRRLRTVKVNGS
jgi:hypothetical protein